MPRQRQKAGVKHCRDKMTQNGALKLRLQGYTYREIGEKQGTSHMAAYGEVLSALEAVKRETHENAEKLRDLEVHRMDAILAELWPRKADPRTADTILRLMDRRAKLMGLDAAQQSEMKVTGLEGLTDEQIASRIEDIVQSARARGDVGPNEGDEKKA